MTALSTGRLTPQMGAGTTVVPNKLFLPIKAATTIYAGSLVALQAGYLVPASSATGLTAVGIAADTYDNSTGSNGTLSAEVLIGAFRFENSASSDAIAQANVGSMAYMVDDQTVALTSNAGARSVAGRILQLDALGVWVLVGVESAAVAAGGTRSVSFSKDAADGAASTATSEHVVHRMSSAGTIAAVYFIPDAALTGDATNNATLSVAKRDGAGGASSPIASRQTTAANGNWTAFVPVNFGTVSNAAVIAGDLLTFAISKGGTGVAVPAGLLVVLINPA